MREDHAYFEELISLQLDVELTQTESDALRAHLRECADCRALAACLAGITQTLRTDETEPPEALAAGVMARIREREASTEPVDIQNAKRSSRPDLRALIAACLVVVVGLGVLAARFGGRKGSADPAKSEAAMEEFSEARGYGAAAAAKQEEAATGADDASIPAEAPPPAPDAGETYNSFARTETDAAPAAAEGAEWETEEAIDAGTAMYDDSGFTDVALIDILSAYTVDVPAQVPAEREDAFRTLLGDAGVTPGEDRTVLCYAECRGVIYEFSYDGAHLCWRDAAEGMPAASPATLRQLAEILL